MSFEAIYLFSRTFKNNYWRCILNYIINSAFDINRNFSRHKINVCKMFFLFLFSYICSWLFVSKFLFFVTFLDAFGSHTGCLPWKMSVSVIGHIVPWFYHLVSFPRSMNQDTIYEDGLHVRKAVGRSLHVRIVCGTVRVIGKDFCNRGIYVQPLRLAQFRLSKVRITDTFVTKTRKYFVVSYVF